MMHDKIVTRLANIYITKYKIKGPEEAKKWGHRLFDGAPDWKDAMVAKVRELQNG